jgi:chromosome segregation ATPase
MALSQQIQAVNEKLQQLLKQYQSLQKDNQRLLKENEHLKEKYDVKNEQTHQLQQKMEALKLTSVALNDDVKKDLEKRINSYLKEIDKCLTLLNG